MAANTNSKTADGKFADLQKDTVELNSKQHMSTDYGIKITDPDHWLRVVDEKKTGPSLLEDQIAREKVDPLPDNPSPYEQQLTFTIRSCVSTTNASQSELCTPAGRVHSAHSNYTKAQRMLRLPGS